MLDIFMDFIGRVIYLHLVQLGYVFLVLTLFQLGSGMTLPTGGGAIMARTDFRLSKMTKRPVSAQNLLSNEYFDL